MSPDAKKRSVVRILILGANGALQKIVKTAVIMIVYFLGFSSAFSIAQKHGLHLRTNSNNADVSSFYFCNSL